MEDSLLMERLWGGMKAYWKLLPQASEGGRALELDGVLALVTPAVPERSILNCVFYDDFAALENAYEELAGTYDAAGVEAWTVWGHPGDAAARRLLQTRAHELDANPAAMALELKGFDGGSPELDWERSTDLEQLARLNDLAYAFPHPTFTRVLPGMPLDGAHTYLARLDGKLAAGLQTWDHGGDAEVNWVATAPEARGRGLATGLMRIACADARDRGCETSTLVATAMGEPVYSRLGFRSLGNLEMWERRKA